MGALAPISPWIPEDDLLLKNAVEAGASLEALAKGAVRFSRRFSIQELQTRWHALLYDTDTSGIASAHMVELELSASNLSSQSNRSGDSKGNGVPGKRKDESVHSHYFAMRKRIRNEPFSNVDLNFLVVPTLHNCQEQAIDNEHPVENCMIVDPGTEHFDLHDTEFDIVGHGFSQVARVDIVAGCDEAATHAYHSEHQDSLGGELPDGTIGGNCLYEFAENVPHVLGNEAIGSNMEHSFEHGNMHNNINVLEEKPPVFETKSGVPEMGPPRVLPGGNLFETSDLMAKTYCEFDLVHNNPSSICSGFGQSQGFNSPVSDCSAKFHHLDYSSPVPTMPIWRTMEDMSTPSILNDENLDDKDKTAIAAMVSHVDDDKKVSSSGYNVVHPNTQYEERMAEDGLKNSGAISEGDFLALSNSLFNFTNEEVQLLMDVDGKDMIDRSCLDGLSSILLSSPNNSHQDDIPSTAEVKASMAMDACLMVPDVACSGGYGDKLPSGYTTCDSNTTVPSTTLAPYPHSPERRNGVICCTLNTEDPDIPCNDDVVLPTHVQPPTSSSVPQHASEVDGSSFPPSTTEFSVSPVASERGINHAKEGEFLVTSMMQPHFMPEMPSNNPITCGVTSAMTENVSLDMTSRRFNISGGEVSPHGSAHLTPYSISARELKENTANIDLGKHFNFDSSVDFHLESLVHCSDDNENHPQNISNDYKPEPDIPGTIQNYASAEHGSFEMPFSEAVVNPLVSDQVVQPSEDDNDVPHFSDIEALILDMDLCPEEDSYLSTEVSRYQYEEAKRAIVRLEQGAHSYMQRAIASRRAFAVLYGRRLKHYIKRPEVCLGRATDDVSVDIDLAQEGRANKISRRQAIIKMEEDGSFSIKNLGKGSILVNGKEVANGHCIKLGSGCLIEIRSMSFIFETNQKAVQQYIANIGRKNQDKGSKFEWSPEGLS